MVALLGFMFWPRPDNAGRLPTLPTPPGVSVPPGMRYVGGDEFDEGAKPDEKRWSRGVIGGSGTATTVENGCMVIRGADEKSLQIWDLQKKFRRGRVEVRMRFSPAVPSWTATVGLVQYPPFRSYTVGGVNHSLSGIWEEMGNHSRGGASVPAGFVTYVLIWDESRMVVAKNGGAPIPVFYENQNSLSGLFSGHRTEPWKIITGWWADRKGRAAFLKRLEQDAHVSIFHKGAASMEIDYVRVFQAE